jgi:hypothetical protein
MSSTWHEYALHGVTLRSNHPLPGLLPGRGGEVLEVDFAGRSGVWTKIDPSSRQHGHESLWRRADGSCVLRYDHPSDGSFWTITYTNSGTSLTVQWSADWLLQDIPAIVQGPGVSLALLLRGVPLLHAGAIAVGDAAILLMGPSGSGKSTTAAALVARGFPLLSDDVAALAIDKDAVRVHPGSPRLRVYAEGAQGAGWDARRLVRVFTTPELDDKRCIEVSAAGRTFCGSPLPVRAIYFLSPRRAGVHPPVLRPLDRRAVLPLLMRNIYMDRFLDPAGVRKQFAASARLARDVPVRLVQALDDLTALPSLVSAIVADAEKCTTGMAGDV